MGTSATPFPGAACVMKEMVPKIYGRLLRWRLWIVEKLRPSPWQLAVSLLVFLG